MFTYYLAQGRRGAVDLDRDGLVTLEELYECVEQEVSRKARSVGGNQHPVMKGELEGAAVGESPAPVVCGRLGA